MTTWIPTKVPLNCIAPSISPIFCAVYLFLNDGFGHPNGLQEWHSSFIDYTCGVGDTSLFAESSAVYYKILGIAINLFDELYEVYTRYDTIWPGMDPAHNPLPMVRLGKIEEMFQCQEAFMVSAALEARWTAEANGQALFTLAG